MANANNSQQLQQWYPDINENIYYLKSLFQSDDLVIRDFVFGSQYKFRAAVCYFDGLVDRTVIHDDILQALMLLSTPAKRDLEIREGQVVDDIKEKLISIGEIKSTMSVTTALNMMMAGETLILIDKEMKVLFTNTRGWPARSISPPENENVVRGPREGFVETMRFNSALIRRWIRDPRLRFKMHSIGERTKTDIGLMYIEDIADPAIVRNIQKRLNSISRSDAILSDAQVEELIEDQFFTIFPTVQTTQRPDKVASSILEGRVAIIVDRSPEVIIAPVTLPSLLQAADDYYNRWPLALIFRSIRWIGFFIAIYLPAIYVALAAFHPELIPRELTLRMAGARTGIPFPTLIEILFLEIAMEVLREASIRLPSALGSTIGIVGGFVLGSAAVEAGLTSPILVIIVAITGLSAYTLPSYGLSIAARTIRFPMAIAAGIAGLYGLTLGTLILFTHLCSLESFGISYLASLSPFYLSDQQDVLIRAPYWAMLKRPYAYRPLQQRRKESQVQNWYGQIFKRFKDDKKKNDAKQKQEQMEDKDGR